MINIINYKQMKYLKSLTILCFLTITSVIAQTKEKPNVLFIFVDDLRPELGAYGNDVIQTPNIDKLASEGTAFMNHYVQVPTCGASRYSILTGTLPHSRKHLSNEVIRQNISGKEETQKPETFIHHLRRNGYYTVGIGKISHYIDGLYAYGDDSQGAKPELPHSWDKQVFNAGKWKDGWDAFFAYADGSSRITKNRQVKPYEKGEVDDSGYPDGLSTELALKELDSLSNMNKPFFLGVGFFKPHLPFASPKKYWDLYDRSEIPLTASPEIPKNISKASLHDNSEFNRYLLGEEKPSLEKPATDEYARKIEHAYYAAASYTDAQVGKLLDKLREKGLDKNTIVVLWGDHGWQLGDHRIWGKHTLFEKALRSPLIIKNPNCRKQKQNVNEIISSIDVYPTLMQLCGVPIPYEMPGKSLFKLIDQNEKADNWKEAAFSYYNNGITVRVPRYRYTKYFRNKQPVIELYDHENDPNENINIANQRPELVKKLDKILERGNTGLYENDRD